MLGHCSKGESQREGPKSLTVKSEILFEAEVVIHPRAEGALETQFGSRPLLALSFVITLTSSEGA